MKRFLLAAAVLAPTLLAAPVAAEEKLLRDWLVNCDNLRDCSAYGFSTEAAEDILYLRIARDGAPGAGPRASLVSVFDEMARPATWTLKVDNKPIAGLPSVTARPNNAGLVRADLTTAQTLALIAAIKSGSSLTVNRGRGAPIIMSLSGASASLLYMDDQQKRVGTVTALARPGTRPASSIPAPPAPPLITAARPAAQTALPRRLPDQVETLAEDCTGDENPQERMSAYRLGPNQMLWIVACAGGAYNVPGAVIISNDRGGAASVADLPLPAGSDPASEEIPLNVEYDPAARVLSSFSKGRGLGDCGSFTRWAWTGDGFSLLSQTYMGECRGVAQEDWPSSYQARIR